MYIFVVFLSFNVFNIVTVNSYNISKICVHIFKCTIIDHKHGNFVFCSMIKRFEIQQI